MDYRSRFQLTIQVMQYYFIALKRPVSLFNGFNLCKDRGGNAALTAPEIILGTPGTWKYLNYSKSDAFSTGAIAYEVFGNPNPFYGSAATRLDSRTYCDEDLPPVNNATPMVESLIKGLLKRNPKLVISFN